MVFQRERNPETPREPRPVMVILDTWFLILIVNQQLRLITTKPSPPDFGQIFVNNQFKKTRDKGPTRHMHYSTVACLDRCTA